MKIFNIILLLFALSTTANGAVLVYDSGFESGTTFGLTDDLSTTPPNSSISVVASPVASGSKAVKYELQRTLTTQDAHTAQSLLDGTKGEFIPGVEYWLSFNYRFENWNSDSTVDYSPFEVHVNPGSQLAECEPTSWINSPFYMWTQDGYVGFNTYGGANRWKATLVKNKWAALTVHFIPSTGVNGLIEAWVDGVKRVSIKGQNTLLRDYCGNYSKNSYLKIGVSKSAWKVNRPLTQSSVRSLVVDNLKMAVGTNGFSLVSAPIISTVAPTPVPESPTTPETNGAVISNIVATPSAISSIITWDSTLKGNSIVEYGTTTSYGNVERVDTSVLSHSVKLKDLTPGQVYHYRVKTVDESNANLVSTDKTFTASPTTLSGLVSDSFDDALNTGIWTFHNPGTDSSTSNAAGVQSIINPVNSIHNLSVENKLAPRIRQTAANTDMVLEAKFNSNPVQNYQGQGIIVEQDANNFLRFDITKNSSGTRAFGATVNASGTVLTQNYRVLIDNPSSTYWLKVTRFDNVWTSYYSQNGTNWVKVGTFTYNMTVATVGIHAINDGSPTPAFTALVDYFKADNVDPTPQVVEPPVISDVVFTPSSTSIAYSYTTNVAGSTKTIHNVSCSTAPGETNNNASLVTSHSGSLTGLVPETPYWIQVCSSDSGSRERCEPIQFSTTTE